jgi:hypothetical protein
MVQAVHLPTPTYAPAIISLDHLEPQPWSSPSDAAREHHSPAPRYRAGHHRPRHEDTKVKGTNSRVAGGKFLGEEETPTVPLAGWVGAAASSVAAVLARQRERLARTHRHRFFLPERLHIYLGFGF